MYVCLYANGLAFFIGKRGWGGADIDAYVQINHINEQVWQGSLKVVQKGQDAAILLIDPKTSTYVDA